MQLEIEKLVYGGDGLARLPADEHGPGKTVFVPFVLPGEKVEASLSAGGPGFARATLEHVVAASPERAGPECPYFLRCGGCHYQHIEYQAQLRQKEEILRETLRRIAKFDLQPEITLHAAAPWNYRNRTRMHVEHQPQFALGYFRHNSRALLPVESCPISSGLINQAIAAVWKLGRQDVIPETLDGLQFFANHDDTKILIEAYVTGGTDAKQLQPFAARLHEHLSPVAGVVVFPASAAEDETRQRAPGPPATAAPRQAQGRPFAVAGVGAPLTTANKGAAQAIGEGALTYQAAGMDYRVSAGSFFQTNRYLIDKLVAAVIGNRTGRTALELYAGAGLFTRHLARNFDHVLAVEASPHAFADLRQNVPANVKCARMTSEAFLAERAAKLAPDLVVLDPPRAGLGEKATTALCRTSASHVTYVSCDPATLARDLRRLLESGYRVEQAHLLDLFPQTYHLETVLHLAR